MFVGKAEVGRSEVGVQLSSPLKDSLGSPEPMKSVASSKIRLNHRRVLEACENRGLRERRNPLMFRN